MTGEYLLSSFEVIELLSQVMKKRDNKLPLNNSGESDTPSLQKKKTLNSIEIEDLVEACDQLYSNEFSKDELTPIGESKAGKGKSPKLLYEMALSIKHGLPCEFSKNELFSLLRYLGNDTRNENPYKPLQKRFISKRLLDFENSCWTLYYPGQDVNLQPRLGCAILEFLSFGRVRLKTIRQEYLGHYHTYGTDEHYLKMNLKTTRNTRDLTILVFCGSYEPQLMLGQFHNIERKITSGKIILEPTADEYNTFNPSHFSINTEEYNQVNEYIRRHIIDQCSSEVVTPSEITTYSAFERYIKHGVKY